METGKGLNSPTEGDDALYEAKHSSSEKGVRDFHGGAPTEILNGHLVELEVDLARVIGEDDVEGDWEADTSPFAAVRAVVPETDDTEMPVNTFRAWFLGIVSRQSNTPLRPLPGCRSFSSSADERCKRLTSLKRCSSSLVLESTSSLPFDTQASASSAW